MEAPTPSLNSLSKAVEILYERKKFLCNFKIIEESIDVSLFLFNSLKYKGSITLDKIRTQILTFSECYINGIFEEIIKLDSDNFSIIKESDKYILKVKFNLFKIEKYLIINLDENKGGDITNNELISYYENIIKEKDNKILELKEIIKFKDEKIKALEEQLKNNKKDEIKKEKIDNIQNDNLYNDFNIKLKNPIHKLKIHTSYVYCLIVLNDGRLVSGACDDSIIIYNKITYQPDLIIKEHTNYISCIIQLL